MGRQHQNANDDEQAETLADMVLGGDDEWLSIDD